MIRKDQKVTIVGAGSTRTPALIGSIINLKNRFPISKLTFYDIDYSRMLIQKDYIELFLKKFSPETKIIFTQNKEEAYSDIDFVFCQMRAGGFELRTLDEKIPLKYDVVGQETCGPGGFSYGMRSIGQMIEMVNDIRKFSKNCWILNYTNPAAIVGLALQKVFPEDKKLLSICDQPYSMLKTFSKILNVNQEELNPRYFGLNHFGWFTNLYYGEKDLIDELKNHINGNDFKPFNAEQREKSWLDTYLNVNKMMSFFDEYVPNTYLQYYLFPDEIVQKSDINFTRSDEAKCGREKNVLDFCKKISATKNIDGLEYLVGVVHGNMMIEIAESIAFDLNKNFILMVKNNKIISNLDTEMLIEVACTLGENGPLSYPIGEIKTFYKAMMDNQYAYEKLTVESFLEKNYEKALQALTLNRIIINPRKAKLILDELIAVNGDYWHLN